MSYDAVLFDCDGVIVEMPDKAVMTEAMRRVQRRFELSDPPEHIVTDFLRGNLSSITERCRSAGVERDTFCAEAAREGVRAQLTELQSGLRSVYDDVAAIQKLNYPMGIVSDNHPRVLSFLLRRFNLTSYFGTVRGCRFTPSGLEHQKPNPHNVQAAMETLGAETALYVGDRQIDVKAADNADIDSVLLRRECLAESEVDVAPTYEVSSLWQLHNVL
ncbi:HAD family hydrolase [Natrialba taiwanensis]|uniref:HAD-superfamily hydrolase n=1 Tax=Natrialba taiwanensis DSM 12281 TaxID=1230458 RepID=M0AGF3_9EURY|nr:HAD family hydrolase [Natrialba taiwanensis]ELY96438.1 HAD-superfamily hydrolase [Natrialba taiwanensis DSM 12281]